MRWTYTLGTLVTLVGVVVTSPVVLWSLAAITSVGIFLPFHPFDLLYNYGMRYLTRTVPLPNSGPQRHFVFCRRDSLAHRDRLGFLRRRRHRGDHARCPADCRRRTGQHHEPLHSIVHLQHRRR